MRISLRIILAVFGCWLIAGAAAAQTLTPTAAGVYSTIQANASNLSGTPTGNIATGSDSVGTVLRGYLIYSVPAGGPITSATLSLNARNVSVGPNTVGVYAVTTSPAQIAAGTAPPAATTTDLGDGILYGTAVATFIDDTLTITLSADALTALNAARGGSIAFGLSNETITGNNDVVFGSSTASVPRTLTIVQAPAPAVPTLSEWAMILLGLILAGGAALHLQRRRQRV